MSPGVAKSLTRSALCELSRTIGNDRGQAETSDGKSDGQNSTPNLRWPFTVAPKSGLTLHLEAIREHSWGCGRQQQFRPLTVDQMNFCTATVDAKHSDLRP